MGNRKLKKIVVKMNLILYLENSLISFKISEKILFPKIDIVTLLINNNLYEHYNKKTFTIIQRL